jgi:hypothetical protein
VVQIGPRHHDVGVEAIVAGLHGHHATAFGDDSGRLGAG